MDENLDLSKNADINEALREFEEKSKIEQAQKAPVLQVSGTPQMTGWVMKWFKIEQKQAEYVLLGFVLVVIGISLYLVFGEGKTEKIDINKIPENFVSPGF